MLKKFLTNLMNLKFYILILFNINFIFCDSCIITKNEDKLNSSIASKGAIVESLFIIKNRKNELEEFLEKVTEKLEYANIIIQEIMHERHLFIDKIFEKQNHISQNKYCLDSEFCIFSIIKRIYPKYMNQIKKFILHLQNLIDLISKEQNISLNKLINIVKISNIFIKISKINNHILNLIFNLQKNVLFTKKYNVRLSNLQKRFNKNKNNKFLENLIKKYTESLSKKEKIININKKKIKDNIYLIKKYIKKIDRFNKFKYLSKININNIFAINVENILVCN